MPKLGRFEALCFSLAALLGAPAAADAAPTAAAPAVAATSTDVTARVQDGVLRGRMIGDVRVFLGIPYAAPPVGPLRWREPQPAAAWEGVRDATQFGASCLQQRTPAAPSHGGPPAPRLVTSENCLYLNIWAPPSKEGPLPVMVWIHGGGFMFGSGSSPTFDGMALAKKGVVLVTINYRLGVFGFLAHPALTAESPHHASGNYGILDQIAALKWVQSNIAQFGGDPHRVTIFGESAGSTSVSILQASPLAKGLFQRAIGESTSQFDPAAGLVGRKDLQQAEAYGAAFAARLGASSLADLRAMSATRILSKPTFFWPTERDGYVLPELVYNSFKQGKQNDVPTLVGSNANEGTVLKMPWVKPDAAEQAEYSRLYGAYAHPIEQTSTDAVEWQMRTWASLQSQTGQSKAWLYWFDHAQPGKEKLGAFHGAEIPYVFHNLDKLDQPWTTADHRISDLISSYWVNFARTGNPNGPGLPQWPAYDGQQPKLMELSTDPHVITTPRPKAQKFLDAYFGKRR